MNANKSCLIAGVALGLLTGCVEERFVDLSAVSAPIGGIKAAKAVEIALKDAGFEKVADVNLKKCEVDGGIVSPVYEIEFTKFLREYEYDIDARSGRIIKSKKEFGW